MTARDGVRAGIMVALTLAGTAYLSAGFVGVMVLRGAATRTDVVALSTVGVVLWMAPWVMLAAAKGAAVPMSTPERECVMMKVVGRHDGDPCASCEIEKSSAPKRPFA